VPRRRRPTAYADPQAHSPNGARPSDIPGRRVDFRPCGVPIAVRLCDGHFFPIQRSRPLLRSKICNSFLPGEQTQDFLPAAASDHAVAHDGFRANGGPEQRLRVTATRIVPGCTCNGKGCVSASPP